MESNKNLLELIEELQEKVQFLEDQIKELQYENIATTNELYRMENSLDARIDILASQPYNLERFSLEK